MRTLLAVLAVLFLCSDLRAQSSSTTQPVDETKGYWYQYTQREMNEQFDLYRQEQIHQDFLRTEFPPIQAPPNSTPDATSTPRLSLKSGKYSVAKSVTISDPTPGAAIYYTTDGWTPNAESARYVGPLVLTSAVTLKAIAIAPNRPRSKTAVAEYVLPSSGHQSSPYVDGGTSQGAESQAKQQELSGRRVTLVFDEPVSSRAAMPGQKVQLSLAEDLKVAEVVVARKGALAIARITEVWKAQPGGIPGGIAFQAESLQTDAGLIKLSGGESTEGLERKLAHRWFVVFAVPLAVLHGQEAEIPLGAQFQSTVVTP
jgi:hypothetical protein